MELTDFQFKAAAMDFSLRLNKDNSDTDVILRDAEAIYKFLKGE
jgi:hypothetical protein